MYDDAYTRNENNELAVRTVSTSGDTGTNKNDVYTRDSQGKLCLRVTGDGGGGGDFDKSKVINKTDVMPAADASTAGLVYMYTGVTDSNYTTNYIYKNVKTSTYTGTVAFTPASLSGTIVTCDGDDFAQFLTEAGADPTPIVSGTMTYEADANGWRLVGKDSNNDTVTTFIEYVEDYEDFGFVFTGTPEDGDVVAFTCTVEEASATYTWTRIDVQPGGGSGGAVDSVNGKTGTVVLNAKDVKAIPQYETMPTASASNVGEIAQYSGETIPDVPASATIEQTTGSGLTDLQVNVDTFEGVEQPSGAETVNFTAIVTQDSVVYDPDKVSDPSLYLMTRISELLGTEGIYIVISAVDENNVATEIQAFNQVGGFFTITEQDLVDNNVVISNVAVSDTIYLTFVQGTTTWEKGGETVDIAAYGVSFTGTPSNGDVLTVSYTPFVAGITNGYFYKSSIEYSDPTATISQTVGSGLTDLAVNVETFIEAEQPTQDEQVEFVSAGTVRTMSQTSGTSGDISLSITNVDDFLTEIGSLDSVYIGAGSVISIIYASGNGDDRPYQISVDYTVNGTQYTRWDLPADQYSIVVSGTSPEGTLMRPIENATVSSEDSWTKDNEPVDIAAYGVSYSGSPTTGDVLTVAYTAPAPVGYSWDRIDVQPSSGSGGGSEIEWAASIDLPDTFGQNVFAQWTVSGGLPDGTYEFYLSSLCTTTNESTFPFNRRVYKVVMKLYTNESQERYFNAIWSPVLNGDFMPDANYELTVGPNTTWSLLWAKGSDIILWSQEHPLFSTDIPIYRSFTAVPDCFKISKIKNMENGMEYIPTGIVTDFTPPQDSAQISGEVRFNLLRSVNIPVYQNSSSYNVSEFAYQGQSFIIYVNNSDDYKTVKELWVRLQHPDSGAEFDATVNFGAYGKATAIQEIRKATGLFANCKFKFINTFGEILLTGFDDTLAGTLNGNVYMNAGASTSNLGWNLYIPQDTLYDIEQGGEKGYRLDTPIAETLGNILQYVGDTDANYTNGYFYKAAGTIVYTPVSVTCTETSSTGKTITMDVDGFMSYMTNIGYTKETIAGWLNDSSWEFLYNVDANELTWSPYGMFANPADVLNFITFSPAASSGEIITWNISNYVPASKTVQNARWDRVNAQPLDLTGVTGYDATKTQVLKNVLGTLTWVDEI